MKPILVAVLVLFLGILKMAIAHTNDFPEPCFEELLQSVNIRPSDPGLRLEYGRCMYFSGRFDSAITQFSIACALRSNSSVCHQWLGKALSGKALKAPLLEKPGLAKRIIREFELAVMLDPSNIEARMDCVRYYSQAPEFLGGGKTRAMRMSKEISSMDEEAGLRARRIMENKDTGD